MLPKVNVIQCDDADYLLLATHDAITTHLQASGTWESHLLAISRLFTHGIHEPLILDIGANLGAYAVPMAKHLDAAKGVVYAYEPQRIVYQQLCGNIFLNRLDNVHAFWMAVGDSDGDIKIPELDYDKSSNIGGFSVVERYRSKTDFVVLREDGRSTKTRIAKLDSLKFPKSPCLLKIDVEGFDQQVIAGGVDLLKRSNFPPLLFEAWGFDWFREQKDKLFKGLRDLGYEITSIIADDYVAQHPRHAVHIDFVTDGSGRFKMTRTR